MLKIIFHVEIFAYTNCVKILLANLKSFIFLILIYNKSIGMFNSVRHPDFVIWCEDASITNESRVWFLSLSLHFLKCAVKKSIYQGSEGHKWREIMLKAAYIKIVTNNSVGRWFSHMVCSFELGCQSFQFYLDATWSHLSHLTSPDL